MFSINPNNVAKLTLAGNSTITLCSEKTGNHYTYKVKKAEDNNLWFVSLLTGRNNDSDYNYIGIYTKERGFTTTAKTRLSKGCTPIQAVDYFFKRINNIPNQLKVFHEGKCCRCGRTLTTPESIAAGIGPECAKMN